MSGRSSNPRSRGAAEGRSERAGAQRKALMRLRRIEGQVRGLQRMVEEQRGCAEVLTQVASVRAALRGTEKLLVRADLRERIRSSVASGDLEGVEGAAAETFRLVARGSR